MVDSNKQLVIIGWARTPPKILGGGGGGGGHRSCAHPCSNSYAQNDSKCPE